MPEAASRGLTKEELSRRKRALREVTDSMKQRRGLGAPVRDAFFRYEDAEGTIRYPMAELMSNSRENGGGRGGRTRVILYITLLWIAAGGKHSSTRPASFWALMLSLPNRNKEGERAIRNAWRELQERNFINLEQITVEDGSPATRVWLLKEDGSGLPYELPTGDEGDRYTRIPEVFWKRLVPEGEFTGPAAVTYFALLRLSRRVHRRNSLVITNTQFKSEYGMGKTTRKDGLRSLSEMLVIDSIGDTTDSFGNSSQRGRRRNLYNLDEDYFPDQMRNHE